MRSRNLRSALVLSALAILFKVAGVPVVRAQSIQGTIVGNITDPTGAVVPNVAVTATNAETKFVRSTTTNTEGYYEFPSLDTPAQYTIKAEGSGFKTYLNENVPLRGREIVRVDIALEVGAVSQQVTVQAQATVVRTDDAKLEVGWNENYLDKRPTNSVHGYGVGATELRSMPGVYYTRQFGEEGSAIMSSGARSTETQINIQGIHQTSYGDYNDPITGLSEIKIERFNAPAEYATPSVIEETLKGGTSEIHAQALVDFRNLKFNAAGWDTPAPKVGTPSYVLCLTAGGPFYIPKMYPYKNKTFWFFTEERNKQTSGVYNLYFNMPTARMRNGDFSTLQIGGKPVVIYDPLTGQPFTGDIIPANRIPKVSTNILNLFPAPNTGDPNVPVRNYTGNSQYFSGITVRSWRGDHNLTNKQTLNFSWGQGRLPQYQDIGSGGTGFIPGLFQSVTLTASDSPSGAWTYAISPTVVNELRIGILRYYSTTQTGPESLNGVGNDWLSQMGIQGISNAPKGLAMPSVSITEVQAINTISQSTTAKTYWTIIDNLTKVWGTHSFKAGVDYHAFQKNLVSIPGAAYGNLAFQPYFTAAPSGVTCPGTTSCGAGFADFLLGLPYSTTVTTARPEVTGRYKELGLYFEDAWKVTRKLTVTYGIREDFWSNPLDAHGLFYNFDPAKGSVVVPNSAALSSVYPTWPTNIPILTAAQAGYPVTLRNLPKFNISPRLGLAWRPWNDKTAIRSGFGIYHDPTTFDSLNTFTGGPFSITQTFLNTYTASTNQFGFQFPTITPPAQAAGAAAAGAFTFSAINLDADKDPYVYQWNVTIDREVAADTRVSLSYIGSKATQLWYGRNINVPPPSATPFAQSRRPYPLFGGITMYENGGNQEYESMELMLYRRLHRGFQFEGGWIWATAINDVADSGSSLGPTIMDPFKRYRGRQYDVVRHSVRGNFVVQSPFGRQGWLTTAGPKVVDWVAGGWVSANTFDFRTGEWLTPSYSGIDISNTSITSGVPDRVCNGNISTPKNYYNPVGNLSCFMIPAAGTGRFGDSGVGIIEGPNNIIWQMSVYKDFPIYRERLKFRIGFQAENIFNHPNFGYHTQSIQAGNAFEATGGSKGEPVSRQLEFQSRLFF